MSEMVRKFINDESFSPLSKFLFLLKVDTKIKSNDLLTMQKVQKQIWEEINGNKRKNN